jgi:hypothetical protein
LSQTRHNLASTPASNQTGTALLVETEMTLEQFLSATAGVAEPTLRSAMTVALSLEPARTPDAYRRFYDRVVHELGLDAEPSDNGRGR